MSDLTPLIQVKEIGKSFGATRALDKVSVEFRPGGGEILAMVGANGAGKSTLIKIICGYQGDYEGKILIEGREVRFANPKEAYDNGIVTVHQIINQGVVQSMTVYENLTLADLLRPGQSVFYDKKALKRRAQDVAALMDLRINMNTPVVDLSQSERQMIAIARALASNPRLLILDEPTSSLSTKEAERLFTTLEQLKKTGVTVLYVSHKLHEITRLADRVVVIRDGKVAATLNKPFLIKEMVVAMVGEIPKHAGVVNRARIKESQVAKLELRDLVVDRWKPPINLSIGEGEIVGLTGLVGAGKTELAQVLFGMKVPLSGTILLDGKEIKPQGVFQAIREGVFYVPEDRSKNGIVPLFNLRQNMTLPFLREFSRLGLIKVKHEQERVRKMIRSMGIKCDGEEAEMDSLSGGNQQKVIVARWLLEPSKLVILDEPFQGVDIRSRHDMALYLRQSIGDRSALIIAADLDEVVEVADRIVVMNTGAVVGEMAYDEVDRNQLLSWISQEQTKPCDGGQS